jgi:Protein of unknown function (DUF1822)
MMSFDSASPALLSLDQLYLEIPAGSPTASAATFSTPGATWRSHLNQAAIAAFLPWLQDEHPARWTVRNAATLASIWEFVNGTAIEGNGIRMVLVPTESLECEELRVAQEWVDLSGWAADYYIAVQVNSEEGWICVQGYTTHHRLKNQGVYDASDRTYALSEDDMIRNINLLWLSREFCPEEPIRNEMEPLPALPLEQATQLIQRLGNVTVLLPRLEVPFVRWGAFLEHHGWRQRLYQQRQGIAEPQTVIEWLRSGVSTVAQQLGWQQMQFQPAVGMRSAAIAGVVRPLTIADRPYQLRVFSVAELRTVDSPAWRFELRSATGEMIPMGFTLRLLSEDLQRFENNQDVAIAPVESLYVDVMLEPGEGIVWEIEPVPDEGDREILRF